MIKLFASLTFFVCLLSYLISHIDELKEISYPIVQGFLSHIGLFTTVEEIPNKNEESVVVEKLFTLEELSQYKDKVLYLSILGTVFDVTKGEKHYGRGQSYYGFVGRDATKAFITGDFTEKGLTDDLTGMTGKELGELLDWSKLYHKEYVYKGKLIGRFYDEQGNQTQYMNEIMENIHLANIDKEASKKADEKYPPCNVQWDASKGSRVWCTTESGGIKRNWVGVPRKYFQPGKNSYRCACVRKSVLDSFKKENHKYEHFEEYKNCEPNSISCYVNEK